MADKAINDLTAATSVGALDLFVLEQNNTAKKLQGQTLLTYLGSLWESYGGITDITMHYAVSSSKTTAPTTWYTTMQSMTATNRYLWSYITITYATTETQDTVPCVIGVWGDQGNTWYTHIKYASSYPTQDSDIGDTPDAYVGIYTGTSASAPTAYTAYDWYGWKGIQGNTGVSITSVTKTGTSGLVDTYTVQFSNSTSTTFTVTNGSNISSITKTGTSGLTDTYTVTLTNGDTTQFTVTNAKSITSITMTGGNHAAGTTDTYTIAFNDGDTATFTVYNGANGTGAVSTVAGIGVSGNQGDVPLIIKGNGAPTTATVGQENQLYFDETNSNFYICLGESGGTYSWAGTSSITVDAAMSTSSENPVQNKVISSKVGTATLTTTAQNCSGAINEHDAEIGNVGSLTTTATNLAGAVNELDGDITSLSTNKVDHVVVVADNTDLDTIVTSGFYRLGSGGNNLPTGADGYSQLIVSRGGDTLSQIFVNYSNSKMFVRSASGIGDTPSWRAWKQIAFNDASNISSASDWLTALGTHKSDFTIYDSVTDVGQTSGSATIAGAYAAMPTYSILYADQSQWASGQLPSGFNGYVWIVKGYNSRSSIEAKGSMATYGDYRMFLDSNGTPTGTWINTGGQSFVIDYVEVDNVTVNAQGEANSTVSAAKTGYTPVGVVGTFLGNASNGGGNNSRCSFNRFYIDSGNVSYRVINYFTSAAKVRIGFYVLYVKN